MIKLNSNIIKAVTQTFNEKLIEIFEVNLVNKSNKEKKSYLVLSNRFIYKVRNKFIFKSFLGYFSKNSLIKEKFDLKSITTINYSFLNDEFIINFSKNKLLKIRSYIKERFIINLFTALESLDIYYIKIQINKNFIINENRSDIIKAPIKITRLDFENLLTKNNNKIINSSKSKITYNIKTNTKLKDFKFLNMINFGSFGKVFLAKKKEKEKLYAIKIMEKKFLIENKYIDNIKTEINILNQNKNQFLVNLSYSFQNNSNLFLVMPFISNWNLNEFLYKKKLISEDDCLFLISQIILGISNLHKKNIVYQDLKPENILIDDEGYIKLCDFGACKYEDQIKDDYQSFIGTIEYIPPEIINKHKYNKNLDIYSLGVLTYQMIFGKTPFFSPNYNTIIEKIKQQKIVFPKKIFISRECKDFILNCLKSNPNKRFNGEGIKAVINHPWLKKINLENIKNRTIVSPFIQKSKSNIKKDTTLDLTCFEDGNSLSKKTINLLKYYEKDFDFI